MRKGDRKSTYKQLVSWVFEEIAKICGTIEIICLVDETAGISRDAYWRVRFEACSEGFAVCWCFGLGFAGEAVAEQDGKGAGDEEEHGAGEEEAVGDPSVVEQAGCLRIQRAEETFDTAG